MSDVYREDPVERARAEGHAAGLVEASAIVGGVIKEIPRLALDIVRSRKDANEARALVKLLEALRERFDDRAKQVKKGTGA